MDLTDQLETVTAGQVVALDQTDYRLLEELRQDGRLSMRALAERIGPSLSAHIYLRIRQHSWKDVRHELARITEIEHGQLVTGENDIVLFVRTRDAESLRALVLDRLQTMDGVLSTHTVLVFDEL